MKHLSATSNSPGDSDYGEQHVSRAVASIAIFPLVFSGFQVPRVKRAAEVRRDAPKVSKNHCSQCVVASRSSIAGNVGHDYSHCLLMEHKEHERHYRHNQKDSDKQQSPMLLELLQWTPLAKFIFIRKAEL
jgi:hypothetical protein